MKLSKLNQNLWEVPDNTPEINITAYQGKEGSYSALASEMLYPDTKKMNFQNIRSACEALKEGSVDVLVLPLENTTAGIVNEVYDRILEFDFFIIKSLTLHIKHCLLAYPGTKPEDIKEVYSHQQALDQCSDYIRNMGIKACPVENTAFAAELVAQRKNKEFAAICSYEAAVIYGLSVIKEDLSNFACNQTKFIALLNRPVIFSHSTKISLAFTLPHESGALVTALSIFSYRGLNLTKIQSRPLADKPWEYCFYMDFQAKRQDKGAGGEAERAIKAIESLVLNVPSVHMLGWYPEN